MPTTPPSTPPASTADPKQTACDALNALLKTATAAASNPANSKAAQDAAFDLRTTIVAQLQALNRAVFTGNTVQLQASAFASTRVGLAQEAMKLPPGMTPAMTQLKALQKQIAALGSDLKEAASILSAIDSAVTEIGALGMI